MKQNSFILCSDFSLNFFLKTDAMKTVLVLILILVDFSLCQLLQDCNKTRHCNDSDVCIRKKCYRKKNIGENCDYDMQCISTNSCQSFSHRTPSKSYETYQVCDCPHGAKIENGTCVSASVQHTRGIGIRLPIFAGVLVGLIIIGTLFFKKKNISCHFRIPKVRDVTPGDVNLTSEDEKEFRETQMSTESNGSLGYEADDQ